MVSFKKSLFFKAKDKKLARKISIRTPGEFKKSIKELRKNGITLKEKRALTLARTRAKLQLRRKNLSKKERKQMRTIANVRIPNVSSKKR